MYDVVANICTLIYDMYMYTCYSNIYTINSGCNDRNGTKRQLCRGGGAI